VPEIEALIAAYIDPAEIGSVDALLIPATARALRIWRRLRLEIGETAVVTDGGGFADAVGLIAAWHGAVPVVRLTNAESRDVETVSMSDAQTAVDRLRAITSAAPGVAAVDLSGRGSAIAILLEALPRWGRLMLAGPAAEPFTTAFYTDIHRKGTLVCCSDAPESIFAEPSKWRLELRNACRLLRDPKRAVKLRACLDSRAAMAPADSQAKD